MTHSFFDTFLPPAEGDMTAAIEAMLREKGACLLGSGSYLVRGVTMPAGTSLMGMGPASRLVLDEGRSEGFAVKLGSRCSVKDLFLFGGGKEEIPDAVGERHGLLFEGTATPKEWSGQPENAGIRGCHVIGFSGGALTCRSTGYDNRSALTVSDCHLLYNGAGIHIPYYSEYHEFTNVLCSHNRYGCINNGGNNVFVNCGFTSNTTAFLMDNSQKQSINNSHGSAVACTFNHSDHNKGMGIVALGAQHGFVFSGCQMFFSKILLEDCKGVIFTSMNFGRDMDVTVKRSKATLFADSTFENQPAFTVEDSFVTLRSCLCRADGGEVQL